MNALLEIWFHFSEHRYTQHSERGFFDPHRLRNFEHVTSVEFHATCPPLLNLPPLVTYISRTRGGQVDAGAPQAIFFGNFSWKTIGKRLFFTVKSLRMHFKIVKIFASGGKNTRKNRF